MPTTTSVYTKVRNTSGVDRFFAFLGKNGTFLEADDDYKVAGDLRQLWATNPLQMDALRRALDDGDLTILKTPDVYVFDETDEQVFILGADNSLPVVADPDTGSYVGDPPTV